MKGIIKTLLGRLPVPDRRNHLVAIHRVGDLPSADYCTPYRIERHVSMATNLLGLHRVIMFFDDAYVSAYDCARSFATRGLRVIISLPTASLSGEEQLGLLDEPQMQLDHLQSLIGLGVEILPHGHTHASCYRMPRKILMEDTRRSLTLVRNLTGLWPGGFVFPYGNYNADLCSYLSTVGVSIGYGLGRGRPRMRHGLQIRNRFCLGNTTSSADERFALSRVYAWI